MRTRENFARSDAERGSRVRIQAKFRLTHWPTYPGSGAERVRNLEFSYKQN